MAPVKRPVWHKVLSEYRTCLGSGLSAQALVAITGVPWHTMRAEMIEWAAKHHDLYVYRCATLKAFLFNYCVCSSPYFSMKQIDQQVKKYPPEKWPGLDKGVGIKMLRVYGGQVTLDRLKAVVARYGEPTAKAKRTKSS